MFWDDDETDDIIIPKKIDVLVQRKDICACGEQMQVLDNNGTKQYICYGCGQMINSDEAFDSKTDEPSELEERRAQYGTKSGEIYMKKVREDVMLEIKKVSKVIPMTEEQITVILKKYLTIRAERIPRAKPRIGLISACIQDEIRVPIEKLSAIFGIHQKYITEGMKTFNKELLPFDTVSIESLVRDFIRNVRTFFPESFWLDHEQNIIDFVKICYYYHIGYDTTIKTKSVGVIWYLHEINGAEIPQKFMDYTGIGKNTLYKFYDKLIVYLHAKSARSGKYPEHFFNRREQLRRFVSDRGIGLLQIEMKGRYAKFLDEYEF